MTYKHYILANKIKDSRDAYRKYLELYQPHWDKEPEGRQKQFIDVNFKYRFIESDWTIK